MLGLKWPDVDFRKKQLHLNRGLVAVGYEVHETRGKTKTARRCIDLDDTTLTVLEGWRALQAAEFAAVGIDNDEEWMFTHGDGNPIHPHALYQTFKRIVANADVPTLRFRDLRHTHGSLLIKDGVPVKVVSERLGHAHIRPHHPDLPAPPARHGSGRRLTLRTPHRVRSHGRFRLGGTPWEQPEEHRLTPEEHLSNDEGPGR